jgi:hypothetical protein
MSVCQVRLILWFVLTGITVVGGVGTDLLLHTGPFPSMASHHWPCGNAPCAFPVEESGQVTWAHGGSRGMGLHQ